jgi:hypothetical protein
VYSETSRSAPGEYPRVTDSDKNFGVQLLNINDFDDEVTVSGGPDQVELNTDGDSEDIEPRQPEGRWLLDAGTDAEAGRFGGDALSRPGGGGRRGHAALERRQSRHATGAP